MKAPQTVLGGFAFFLLIAAALSVHGQAPPRPAEPRSGTSARPIRPRLWCWHGIYGPRPAFPVWLRTSARSLRPLYALPGPVRTVYVGGSSIVVAEPQPVVLPEPPTETTMSLPPEARSPFVEFALLVEKRLQDLDALMDGAVRSQQGITELEGNKFSKA